MKMTVLFFLVAASGVAQPEAVQTVVAHGEATINARPDQARVQLGVVTQAQTAQAAGSQNATQTSAVLAELRKTMGTGAEIKTVNYSVYPNYTQPKEGRTAVISGYTASNIVEVTLNDLTLTGRVIDAGTRAGANNVQGVQFTLRDEQKSRGEALSQAAKQARANADALAGALGMRIRRVVRVEDSGATPIFPMRQMERLQMAAADAMVAPVEPGTVQIRATVRVTAEVGP